MGSGRSAAALLGFFCFAWLGVAPAVAGHDNYGTAELGAGAGLESSLLTTAVEVPGSPLALPDQQETAPLGAGTADDFRSKGFRKLDRKPIKVRGKGKRKRLAEGSDLAIQGRLMVAGTYDGIGLFRTTSRGVRQISFYRCPGAQGDISIIGDHVFVSIDEPSTNERERKGCNDTPTTDGGESSAGTEGLRVVDISNPRKPRQAAFVETDCGSHTHTLIPGGETSHIYVLSYPLSQQDECTELDHPEGEISIVSFPTAHPDRATVDRVVDLLPVTVTPDTVGCHDVGVLPAKDLAAIACLGAFAILDISDPGDPQTLSVVQNPLIELDHSAQLTWDGKVAIIGDEHAGAAGGGGCSTDQASPVGAMWFYDVSDPESPQLQGSYSLPRVPPVRTPEEAERFRCTTHNYSILPMRDRDRYVAVSPYYSGGLSIVDFSDPAAPEEQAFYLPQAKGINPDMWSGYWYRGRIYTNENASGLGVSVFKAKGFGRAEVRSLGRLFNPQTQVLR